MHKPIDLTIKRTPFGRFSPRLATTVPQTQPNGHKGDHSMSAKRPILIVEDDEALRETLAEQLAEENVFTIATAGTLEEADAAINGTDARFDAVILDIGLPDGDGRDYCARLRKQGHRMPVIMLT